MSPLTSLAFKIFLPENRKHWTTDKQDLITRYLQIFTKLEIERDTMRSIYNIKTHLHQILMHNVAWSYLSAHLCHLHELLFSKSVGITRSIIIKSIANIIWSLVTPIETTYILGDFLGNIGVFSQQILVICWQSKDYKMWLSVHPLEHSSYSYSSGNTNKQRFSLICTIEHQMCSKKYHKPL